MKLVHKIDPNTGYFIEDVIYEEQWSEPVLDENGNIDPNFTPKLLNPIDPSKGLVDVQPVGFHKPKWDFNTNQWVEGEDVSVLLDNKKRIKKNEIKTAYEQAINSGFICSNGIVMDSEPLKVQMLKSGYELAVANGATTMDIRDFNNTVHKAVPIADVEVMIKELSNNIVSLLQKKWDLEAQIEVVTDEATLSTITW